jgi:hypothetical protein
MIRAEEDSRHRLLAMTEIDAFFSKSGRSGKVTILGRTP